MTSTGGLTIGEESPIRRGARLPLVSRPDRVHAHSKPGDRLPIFVAHDVDTRSDIAPKTSVLSLTTDIVAGFGTGMVTGYVRKNDVVTP